MSATRATLSEPREGGSRPTPRLTPWCGSQPTITRTGGESAQDSESFIRRLSGRGGKSASDPVPARSATAAAARLMLGVAVAVRCLGRSARPSRQPGVPQPRAGDLGGGLVHVDPDPPTPGEFGRDERRAAAARRVHDQVAGIRQPLDDGVRAVGTGRGRGRRRGPTGTGRAASDTRPTRACRRSPATCSRPRRTPLSCRPKSV